jgi:DNA (cytosine-5)-methyltransferase 1
MKIIEKQEYSIFPSLENDISTKQQKVLQSYIKDFIKCIIELYEIKDEPKGMDIPLEVYEFLIQVGVIDNISQLEMLEKILKKNYYYMLRILAQYVKIKTNIDRNLMKYMDYYRKEAVEKYMDDDNSPGLVDFFCGAGGMSLGFSQNGFKVVLANDIEGVCTETYSFNHLEIPKSKVITGDIKIIVDDIGKYIDQEVAVVIGGPPCQGFSMANRQRLIEDPRNILYKYYVKGIENIRPKFFVMENVKGMLSVADQVKEDFHNLMGVDYDVYYHLFNAKEFGVPQNRERLIYIGVRSDIGESTGMTAIKVIEEIENKIMKQPKHMLQDAIGDLKVLQASTIKNATELDTVESGKKIEKNQHIQANSYVQLINCNEQNSLIFNHKARYNNDRDIEIFERMWPGDKSDSERIADIMPYKNRSDIFKDKYYKLKIEEVCKTITAHMKFDCNMYIHPLQARGLTPREAARVQSYPDEYMFCGAYTKTYMQIGNSVPPLMSRIIASIIRKYV